MTRSAAGEQTATHLCEVDQVQLAQPRPGVVAASLETPAAGARRETWALAVTGWAVGDAAPARAVHVTSSGAAWALPVHDRRPDVGALHPQRDWAGDAGFSGAVNSLRLEPRFELEVTAELGDGARAPIAHVEGRRAPLRSGYEPELRPLVVTTLGRTGSTWLIHLLAGHPGIVAYRPFSYEPRAATYWVDALTGLSEPASYMQQVEGEVRYPGPWWLGADTGMAAETLPDEDLARWLGSENVGELAAFAQQRIDSLYRRIGAAAGKRPVFFAEKCLPEGNVPQLLRELYPDSRELVLVRDLRDMLCSILSFNRKRDRPAFGLESGGDVESYVRQVLAPSVAKLLRAWRARDGESLLVRYEDLVTSPRETLREVLAHAGLESDQATVDALLARGSAPAPGMEQHRTAAAPDASIGRWRTDLDPALVRLCEEAFGAALAELGYEPAGGAAA